MYTLYTFAGEGGCFFHFSIVHVPSPAYESQTTLLTDLIAILDKRREQVPFSLALEMEL